MTLQRLMTVLLLGICLAAGYYLYQKHWDDGQQIEPDAESALFSAEGVTSTSYDEKGNRSYRLQSSNIEYFQQQDETHLHQPVLHTYTDGITPEWELRANSAVLEKNHLLIMSGNVTIMNLLESVQIKQIATEQLTLDLLSRDFWSNVTTYISGVNFETQGDWIKGNFGSHQMELLQQVKSKYEPENN